MIEVGGRGGAGLELRLDDSEAALLRRLAAEMRIVLETGADDDVTKRLYPDAYDDAADAKAYRELVGDELVRTKLGALERVEACLQQDRGRTVSLAGADVDAWLATLTDMRLAIGTRLDVDEEKMSRELNPADASSPALSVLHWLGWLQESILHAETQR